jgi:hypothetical protein
MLVYPNTLGLEFNLGMFWYICLELLAFFGIATLLNRQRSRSGNVATAFIYLIGRFILSTILFFFLLIMERASSALATDYAYSDFKPALLLFSLTAPFLFNSTAKGFFPEPVRNKKGKLVRQKESSVNGRPTPAPQIIGQSEVMTAPMPSQRSGGEYFDRSFSDAVEHIGSYSGVLCAMLIDSEGLPVASWDRGNCDLDMWGGLARKMIDEMDLVNLKAGSGPIDHVEFISGGKRFYLHKAMDMWLLSIADAASDELEKIRVNQAAEMVQRHCSEKFRNIYTPETGRQYAGSTF